MSGKHISSLFQAKWDFKGSFLDLSLQRNTSTLWLLRAPTWLTSPKRTTMYRLYKHTSCTHRKNFKSSKIALTESSFKVDLVISVASEENSWFLNCWLGVKPRYQIKKLLCRCNKWTLKKTNLYSIIWSLSERPIESLFFVPGLGSSLWNLNSR